MTDVDHRGLTPEEEDRASAQALLDTTSDMPSLRHEAIARLYAELRMARAGLKTEKEWTEAFRKDAADLLDMLSQIGKAAGCKSGAPVKIVDFVIARLATRSARSA